MFAKPLINAVRGCEFPHFDDVDRYRGVCLILWRSFIFITFLECWGFPLSGVYWVQSGELTTHTRLIIEFQRLIRVLGFSFLKMSLINFMLRFIKLCFCDHTGQPHYDSSLYSPFLYVMVVYASGESVTI